ncbi:hypothetical protein NQZ79_g3224 [Umbelopsis isabellina]|nr:hypothetical protein NQZ79_g3224 [Umbelopsis isabellina]
MASLSEPQQAVLPPIELQETKNDNEPDMTAKNDSHMAIRISAVPEYNKGSRFQEEHDSLLNHSVNDDAEPSTERLSVIRSKKFLIISLVSAAILIIAAIACKCSSESAYHILPRL